MEIDVYSLLLVRLFQDMGRGKIGIDEGSAIWMARVSQQCIPIRRSLETMVTTLLLLRPEGLNN